MASVGTGDSTRCTSRLPSHCSRRMRWQMPAPRPWLRVCSRPPMRRISARCSGDRIFDDPGQAYAMALRALERFELDDPSSIPTPAGSTTTSMGRRSSRRRNCAVRHYSTILNAATAPSVISIGKGWTARIHCSRTISSRRSGHRVMRKFSREQECDLLR